MPAAPLHQPNGLIRQVRHACGAGMHMVNGVCRTTVMRRQPEGIWYEVQGGKRDDRLGEVEKYFIKQLMAGDSFVFAGEILRFEGLRELDAIVTRAHATEPKVPAYEGGKFPLSTYLAERVRQLLAEPGSWSRLPDQVSDWLRFQADVSIVPGPDEILVETFPRGHKHYLGCYPFAAPLGFVANE